MKLTQLPSDAFEPTSNLIACPECDLIMRKGAIAEGVALECPHKQKRLKTYGAFFGDKNHKAFSRFCLCGHEKSGLSGKLASR